MPNRKLNLESLIAEDMYKDFNDIRIKGLPQLIEKIGEGGFADVFKYSNVDGSLWAGKQPRISLFSMSSKEEERTKKVSINFHCPHTSKVLENAD